MTWVIGENVGMNFDFFRFRLTRKTHMVLLENPRTHILPGSWCHAVNVVLDAAGSGLNSSSAHSEFCNLPKISEPQFPRLKIVDSACCIVGYLCGINEMR